MKAIFRKVYGVFIGLRWLLGVSHNTDRRSMYRRGYDYAVSELRAGGAREARVLDRYGSLDGSDDFDRGVMDAIEECIPASYTQAYLGGAIQCQCLTCRKKRSEVD